MYPDISRNTQGTLGPSNSIKTSGTKTNVDIYSMKKKITIQESTEFS